MKTLKDKEKHAFETLKKEYGFTNVMQAPRLVKAVISTGVGSFKDKKKFDIVMDRLAKITGQKPTPKSAKKSIAGFKMRQGDTMGYQVTLRGPRMYGFLERLINISLPRTRDFRGITKSAVDAMGNITIGIREHTIFPETNDEELKDVFGMAITVVTTAKDRKTAETFFRLLGFPLAK